MLQCQGYLSLDVGKIITVYMVPFASGSCYLVLSEVAQSPCGGASALLDKRGQGLNQGSGPATHSAENNLGTALPRTAPRTTSEPVLGKVPPHHFPCCPSQPTPYLQHLQHFPHLWARNAPCFHQDCAIEAPLCWDSGQPLCNSESIFLS